MSPPLADLQRAFLATMRGTDAGAVLPNLAPGRHASPDLGLAIYRNAYSSRLREALENDHPALGTYLGDALWASLCEGYIAANPSKVRSLRNFGASLPGYLRTVQPYSTSPQIAELAEWERRLLDCFDAADADRAEWSTLLSTPEAMWPSLRLRFHPSVQLHQVAWNSVEIWRALKDGQTPPSADLASSAHWLLWRDSESVTRFRSLGEDETAALAHFLGGGDFSGLCEQLLRWQSEDLVPATALEMLNRWCAEGLIGRWQLE